MSSSLAAFREAWNSTPRVELLLDTWTDISLDVRQADGITITRGRSDEATEVDASTCALTLDNRDGKYSPRNSLSPLYRQIGRNTMLRVLEPSSTKDVYLALPGHFDSYASTPDAAGLDITGDIDVRVDLEPRTWRPSNQYGLARKWVDDDGELNDQGSWRLDLQADGTLRFIWTTAGAFSASLDAESTAAIPEASMRLAVRATLDVDNGAAGRDITFWTSPDGVDGTWTQLGATVTQAGTTSIFNSSVPVEVGRTVDGSAAQGDTPDATQGRVYGFQLRSGIAGTIVAAPDFMAADVGTTAFTEAQGNTWTLHGTATMVNPNARMHGEVAEWPPRWNEPGTDSTVPIEAAGLLRRLGQGEDPVQSALRRELAAAANVVAYWPCEDESEATTLASALPGGFPMTFLGTGASVNENVASFDGFACSKPLPLASEVQWIGHVPSYAGGTSIRLNFLLAVPAGGVASGTELCRFDSEGSINLWRLNVGSAGGLRLLGNAPDGTEVVNSGLIAGHDVNGKLLRVSIRLTFPADLALGTVAWAFASTEVEGATTITSGTIGPESVGRVTQVRMNKLQGMDDVALGHIVLEQESGVGGVSGDTLAAFDGESATRRILRLCAEESIPTTLVGGIDEGTALGPQLSGSLLGLLREAAAADLGILYEARGHAGLEYRTRDSLLGFDERETSHVSDPALILDYSVPNTLASIEPVDDDQGTRNDITVERIGGSSIRKTLEPHDYIETPMSVAAPPDGVGQYVDSVSLSLHQDSQLADQACWRLHLGTVDEARFPVLGFNLSSSAWTSDPDLTADALALDIGDTLELTNLPSWMPPDDVPQIVQGFTEFMDGFVWRIEANCSPGSPWTPAVWDESSGRGEARYSSDGSVLSAVAPEPAGTSALRVNGTSPGRARTPDAAALDIVGDLDVRALVALDDWTPAAIQAIASKWVVTGNQRAWFLQMQTGGLPRLAWSANGSTVLFADSTAAPTVADGAGIWLRATLDVDNGASGRDITFYTSADPSAGWTQLGTTVTQAGVTSIFNSTAEVAVSGFTNGTTNPLAGYVSKVEIRNGIGTPAVANPDFAAQDPGATTFTDDAGLVWTINSPAVIEAVDPSVFQEQVYVETPEGPLWSDDDAPFDLMVGGERMTVTAIETTSETEQTFTVIRAVNGIRKAHAISTEVRLFKPSRYVI
jgi:hypothetical protein